jgi:hypothetical protein
MGEVWFWVVVAAAAITVVLAVRRVSLRIGTSHPFDCAIRSVEGTAQGTGPRFRHGMAGTHVQAGLVWRPLYRFGPAVTIPLTAIRFDAERAPGRRERLLTVPPAWLIVPVDAPDGSRLELAFHRRTLPALLDERMRTR